MMNPIDGLVKNLKMNGVRKCDIEETIRRIQKKMDETDAGTDEMTKLGIQMEQALKNKKLYKEAKRWGISWDTVAIVVFAGAITYFGFCLDLESPRALKIATQGLKLLPAIKIHG
jgi:hypothetical protein